MTYCMLCMFEFVCTYNQGHLDNLWDPRQMKNVGAIYITGIANLLYKGGQGKMPW